MEKLRNGNFVHQIATADEVKAFVDEAERMIEKYGWQDRTMMPFSWADNVMKLIGYVKDYERCSFGSKQYLITLANGMIDVLMAWEKQELAPKIAVRIVKTGVIKEMEIDFAKELIDLEVAVAV